MCRSFGLVIKFSRNDRLKWVDPDPGKKKQVVIVYRDLFTLKKDNSWKKNNKLLGCMKGHYYNDKTEDQMEK